MRALLLCLLVGCATDIDDADDPAWAEATEPDVPAELEDPADDGAVVEDVVDDAADPDEADDAGALAAPAKFTNPLGPNCADPGAITVGGVSYVACTGNGYPMWKSTDLVHWKSAGKIFSLATKPKWAGGNYWAPEIHANGDGFIAYFTALSPSRGKMCIGAARATSVTGPYKDIGRPLVCDSHVSLIDATVFHDAATGKRYLYYKTDGNGLSPKEKTILYGHELKANGIGFVGTRRALLRNTLAWEGDVVEAPWVHHRGSFYYLFYSGFRYCNATYGVGIARSRSPLGPFVKKSGPILKSNAKWSGPGHNAVVRRGGRPWIVYHAWSGAHDCEDGGSRKLMLDPIGWKGGWPFIGDGTPSRGPVVAP
jgi:arabinan endo-1,5-alpha-L-arabinosidase